MTEPWNNRIDDQRGEDIYPTFIIFCEDDAVEPNYFNAFRSNNKIQISTIPNCGQHHKQVDFATKHCEKSGLLEVVGGKYNLKLDLGAQVWCVFDRDKNIEDDLDMQFTNSISQAESKGFKVAWSNDNFELWILLHFEDVPVKDDTYQSRKKYYDRLTEIIKLIEPKTDAHEKITQNIRFSYDPGMKRANRFLEITLQHMKGKTNIAISRAKALEEYHSNPPKPNHEKAPCTLVHHLVQELILIVGKEI